MKLVRINGEKLWAPDEVRAGEKLCFRRVDEIDGVPVVEVVEKSDRAPFFGPGPGNGRTTDDPQIDGEKWNQLMNDQHQVAPEPMIGQIPRTPQDEDLSASSDGIVREAQAIEGVMDPTDAPPIGDEPPKPWRRKNEWKEAEVEAVRMMGDLLLLTIGDKSYLVVYDDLPRRAGIGPGARIRYRMVPKQSLLPGLGRLDVDQIQLSQVLIPAPLQRGRAEGA